MSGLFGVRGLGLGWWLMARFSRYFEIGSRFSGHAQILSSVFITPHIPSHSLP